MRTLSVLQPWATLLIAGTKRFDARGWRTTHRGLLAIHACSRFPRSSRDLCEHEPYRSALRQLGLDSPTRLPLGVVLGTVHLLDCVRIAEVPDLTDDERRLGDYPPDCWVWRFADPVPLAEPVPVSGRLGVFESPLPFPLSA
jgi:hypothetical protein